MKSICFFNNKGGVGKTTLTCNLASAFSLELGKKVLVIDCDPQCNATALILGEQKTIPIYWQTYEKPTSNYKYSTILDILHPIEVGEAEIDCKIVPFPAKDNRFNVDLIAGHPRLSIIEDLLSSYWRETTAGDIGGIRKTNWFTSLGKSQIDQYDAIFIDLGPSLGSLNRSVLLGSDYFVTPMGADIFSLIGLRNISDWLAQWIQLYKNGIDTCDRRFEGQIEKYPIKRNISIESGFVGYTIQAYIAKSLQGKRRPTDAFERILSHFPDEIQKNLGKYIYPGVSAANIKLGEVPNMYSLIPLAQNASSPIGSLKPRDGIVGAHYLQVDKYQVILNNVASALAKNIKLLGKSDGLA